MDLAVLAEVWCDIVLKSENKVSQQQERGRSWQISKKSKKSMISWMRFSV
jgi:hypothetical protein